VHWPFEVPGLPATSHQDPPQPSAAGDLTLYQGPTVGAPATRHDYVRMLERADEGVGQILAMLDRRGLTGKTMVIFTNDNGGEWLSRNAPLRDRKSTLWEGGLRVPLIIRWPGHLPANKTSAQVAITMDLTASILAATNSSIPVTHRLDGINLLPTLGRGSAIVDRELFWRIKRPRNQRAVRSGRWKLVQDINDFHLFDLSNDPGERNDLTAAHPDLVRKLNTDLDQWEKSIASQNRVTASDRRDSPEASVHHD
jgi:arylsulfatase A-like enzyme